MPKAPATPPLPLNGLFPIAKPSGPPSMRIIDSINPLLLESRLFFDPSKPRDPRPKNKRKKNTTHMGLKIGQGGTLDPLADGVLVIGVNRGTKHLNRFLECSKEYESIGLLGATTTTFDSEGPVLSTAAFDNITREDIERVLDNFRGKIKQTPPIFSALKMDGKPLYEYARESKPLPRPIPVRECTVSIDLIDFKPASVTAGDGGHTYRWPEERLSSEEKGVFHRLNKIVHDAQVDGAQPDVPVPDLDSPDVPETSAATGLRPAMFTVRMTVSSGTYVRSIVHDIGLALGCGAHVVKLTRTRQGEFVLHGDEEGLATTTTATAAAVPDATVLDDEEAAMNGVVAAAPSSSAAAAVPAPTTAAEGAEGPTTGCIPWSVWENALKEREETVAAEAREREEAAASGMSEEELELLFSDDAIAQRRRQGDLKEWEVELLRRFVPVPLPVVRDSKSRAAGLY